jgi:hypothetical protein
MSQDAPCLPTLPAAIREIVTTSSLLTEVAAIALAGSRVAAADTLSDYDIYVYTTDSVPLRVRRALADRYDPQPEIANTWLGEEDGWNDSASGTAIELIYRDRGWIEATLCDVIDRHQASVGYTTAHWYSVCNSTPLFDRDGWFAGLQKESRRPYPDELRQAIMSLNHPLLRTTRASYRHQIDLALERDDLVNVQHRVTALLASVFDIVFAARWALHPGEKRQLSHVAHLDPIGAEDFSRHVHDLIRAEVSTERCSVLQAIDDLCDDVDGMVRSTDAARG